MPAVKNRDAAATALEDPIAICWAAAAWARSSAGVGAFWIFVANDMLKKCFS